MNIYKHQRLVFLLLIVSATCCRPGSEDPQQIVDRAIESHGGITYSSSIIEFDFRGRHYYRFRENGNFEFRREWEDTAGFITDILSNSGYTRKINGNPVQVEDEWEGKYTRSVNSVIYFALLPFRLNDEAVLKTLNGVVSINGKDYYEILVRFRQEGGGEDYQDEFLYWINKDNYEVDYFAYSYETDGGGIRFREVIEKIRVGNVLFQNYRNYSEPKDESIELNNILEKYKKGQLPLLSEIILENLKVTPL